MEITAATIRAYTFDIKEPATHQLIDDLDQNGYDKVLIDGQWLTMQEAHDLLPPEAPTRFAEVFDKAARVARYLPSNYMVLIAHTNRESVIIGGQDEAGWTLDGYVLPRLASGNIRAREMFKGTRDAD